MLLFVYLCRYMLKDRPFVQEWFQCYEFNNVSKTYPNRNSPAKYGKCADQHETENWKSKHLKPANCVKARVSNIKAHTASSRECPILVREQSHIQKRTNYSKKNNYASQFRRSFWGSAAQSTLQKQKNMSRSLSNCRLENRHVVYHWDVVGSRRVASF